MTLLGRPDLILLFASSVLTMYQFDGLVKSHLVAQSTFPLHHRRCRSRPLLHLLFRIIYGIPACARRRCIAATRTHGRTLLSSPLAVKTFPVLAVRLYATIDLSPSEPLCACAVRSSS
ncbi:hypothetical protein C8R43DRAFT_240 [Mycena crocata]|nr:hypothetical protein C8R43DRAFT_240 [Mycena crocata]